MVNTRTHTLLPVLFIMITTSLSGGSLIISEPEKTTVQTEAIDLTLPSTESPAHKSRMRKKDKKIKKEKKIQTYKDMDYDQLIEAKNVLIAKGSYSIAIKYLDQVMKLCNDITKLAEHLLEVADLFYLDSDFQKASRLYTEFAGLYPGNEKMEYALYRAIQSSFFCILSNDRDQTKTEETVGLTEIFLTNAHFTEYKEAVKEIQIQCYEQLATSECNVCHFYITRDKFTSAGKRLTKLRAYWLPKVPKLEADIIALETELTEKKEAAELLHIKNTERETNKQLLASSFAKAPEDKQNKKTKRMTDRF